MTLRAFRLLAPALLAALGVAACGGSVKTTPPTPTTTATTTTTSSSTSTTTAAVTTTTSVATTTSTAPGLANWTTPPARSPDGSMPVAAFNTLLATAHPTIAGDPSRIAGEYLKLDDMEAGSIAVDTNAVSSQLTDVVVTADRIPDDSVRALRFNLRLARQSDQTWRLVTAAWSQQCQPNRGHQNFTTQLCI